jgi:hypothetical protein
MLAPPEQALEVTQAIEGGQLKPAAEGQNGWRIEAVPPWSSDAIAMLINETGSVADAREVSTQVRELTGGFTSGITKLCTQSLTSDLVQQRLQAWRKAPLTEEEVLGRIGLPQAFDGQLRVAIREFLTLVHGDERSGAVAEDARTECRMSEALQQYLVWMGLLQEGDDNRWEVPQLYLTSTRSSDGQRNGP